MQIGKICKTLGYGGILCSALVFAKPCHCDNQFIFDTTHASYAPSTTSLIINQYSESQFVNQNADKGGLLFQNGSALNINASGTSLANALSLYNGVDFTMSSGNGSDITSAGALSLTGGTSDGTTAFNGSSILVQRESGYSTYWDSVCNTEENIGAGKTYEDQHEANLAKAITTNINLKSNNTQNITGQYGIKIVGLRSASSGYGTTDANTDYAGDIVNITLGGTGINNISGTSGAISRFNTDGTTSQDGTSGREYTGTLNATVAAGATWSFTGNTNVDFLTLENGSTLNLKLQETPTNTSGGSVMTVNTAVTLPTGATNSATVGLQWQKVSNQSNADVISQSYLVLPSSQTEDWSKLKINLTHIGDPVGSGTDWKLDEDDKILLVSNNSLNTGTAAFSESNLLFNGGESCLSSWFTDGEEAKFELDRTNGNLYAKVAAESIKMSHYSYPSSTTKRAIIYPRFATVGDIPSLKNDENIIDACQSDYAYRSHLNVTNSLQYSAATDKAAVTIMNNYQLNSDTWSAANSIETNKACDVLITIDNDKAINRELSTGDALSIGTSDDNSYIPAIRITSVGTGAINSASTNGSACGVKLIGASFVAHNNDYAWGSYAGHGDSVTGYAYRFESPITATASSGKKSYGIYMSSDVENVGAQVLITKDISATGGTSNYAVYGKNTNKTNHGVFEFHFGGGTAGTPNEIKTTGDLLGNFFVDQYAGLDLSAVTAVTGKFTNNGTVDVNAATTFSDLFTNNASSNVTIGANTTFTGTCTNSGTITVDGASEIIGNLTHNGAIAVNADAKFVGSLTGEGKITVGSASEYAFFDCSGEGCSLALAPTTEAAITCETDHSGIVAIKTRGTTDDSFGKSGNVAFSGQSTSNLLLAGNGGTVNGEIKGLKTLIFGYHLGAPELNNTRLFGESSDTDANSWTLNGAVTCKDIIVRHGNITAKGSVNLSGQLYVLGGNFCSSGSLVTAGGLYIHEEFTTLSAPTTISNGKSNDITNGFESLKSQHNVTDDGIAKFAVNGQMKACITLNSSAKKGGAALVVDSNNVKLNSYTVDGNNIGILAIGNENTIYLNSMPAINYLVKEESTQSTVQAASDVPSAPSAPTGDINFANCYAIKGNETTTLKIGRLSSDSKLNGKVEVGEMSIDATGGKLTLTNDKSNSGNGVFETNKLTVNLISLQGYELIETKIPTEAKLDVATLASLSGNEINLEIIHIGKAVDGDKIPLVKCGSCTSVFKPKQPFLRKYEVSYDKDGYVATVTKSMTHEQAARKLGLDASYGRLLDSDSTLKDKTYSKQFRYGFGEQSYTTIANWSARSDHMEKSRVTSSMMSAYNEAMFARRVLHNFNQEHKLISWISGFGDWFKQGDVKHLGAKANTYGIIAGADYQLNDKWLFSLSCGYANSDVKLNGKEFYRNNGSGHQDSFVSSTAMAYKNKVGNGEFSATGLFTSAFVHHKYNYKLQINENNADENESGHEKYHGFALSLGLDADWMFNYKDTAVKYGPIVQVGFDRTSQDGHTTTCSDSDLCFSTKEANVNNLWSILGAKVTYDCTLQQKKVNMYCQAGWKFQYLRNGADVRRNMFNSRSEFTATGTYVDKSMLAVKLGVSLLATESFNLGVEYGLDYNSKVHSNRANVEMSYVF